MFCAENGNKQDYFLYITNGDYRINARDNTDVDGSKVYMAAALFTKNTYGIVDIDNIKGKGMNASFTGFYAYKTGDDYCSEKNSISVFDMGGTPTTYLAEEVISAFNDGYRFFQCFNV